MGFRDGNQEGRQWEIKRTLLVSFHESREGLPTSSDELSSRLHRNTIHVVFVPTLSETDDPR